MKELVKKIQNGFKTVVSGSISYEYFNLYRDVYTSCYLFLILCKRFVFFLNVYSGFKKKYPYNKNQSLDKNSEIISSTFLLFTTQYI